MLHSSWLSYLPWHIADDLLRQPEANPVGREQRFEVVALFADISGFTRLSEALAQIGRTGTEELTDLLNLYFVPMVALIQQSYGGIVAKFGGDSLTVLFPYNSVDAQSEAVRRATRCALAMQAVMPRYQSLQTGAGTFSLAMKAGLACGPVFSTTIGDPAHRLEYVIAGKVLERAALASEQAAKGQVVCHSDDLISLLRPADVVVLREEAGFAWLVLPEGSSLNESAHPYLPLLPEPSPALIPILAAYLHPVIARRIETNQLEFINEHRTVTTLFVCFGGFDYDHDPQVGFKLQAYLSEVLNIVRRYDGCLQQTDMGDKGSKYVVFFGTPVAHENDAERALRCAWELQQAARNRGVNTATGINMGLVYCGLLGSNLRQSYVVIGDGVNLAARLMQAAQPGQILASVNLLHQSSTERIASLLTWQELSPLSVKGKAAPVAVGSLLGIKEPPALRLREPVYTLPMVGRENELALVEDLLGRVVSEGEGQILGITAEAGMGKSRLLAEIIRRSSERWLVGYGGEGHSYGTATPYLAWRSLWQAFFYIASTWTLEDQLSVLETQLALTDPAFLPRLPLLGTVLNLPLADNDLTHTLEGQMRKSSLEGLLIDCLRARAKHTPLLLVLEDAHWLDPLSLDLLETVARSIHDVPVLLVLAYRPTDTGTANPALRVLNQPCATQIHLTELTSDEAHRLIQHKLSQLFDHNEWSPVLIQKLAVRAAGNPFYLEELLNYLKDRNFDPQDESSFEQLEWPTSLHNLILSRIDRLSESQQLTLKLASIIGRFFRADWLWGSYASLGDPIRVKGDLDTLSQLDLTPLNLPEPDLSYLFKHIVTQEVAYESLTYATRATLHEQLGHFIEQTYRDAPEQYVDLLAYHYGRSLNENKKREYLRKAGEAAQTAFANSAALNYFRRLLPLLPPEEQAEIQLKMGQIMELVGDWQEALVAYRQSMQQAGQLGDALTQAQCQSALGGLLSKQGQYDEALNWLAQARVGFTQLSHLQGVSEAVMLLANVYRQRADYPMARALCEESLALSRQLGHDSSVAQSLHMLGAVAWRQGQYDTARKLFQESLAIRRDLSDRLGVAQSLNMVGAAVWREGQYLAARVLFRESLELARELGDKWGISNTLNNLAMLARTEGNHAKSVQLLQETLALKHELGDKWGLAGALHNLGIVVYEQGDYAQAGKLFHESLILRRELGSKLGLAECLAGLASVVEARDSRPESARQAVKLAAAAQFLLTLIDGVFEPDYQTVYENTLTLLRSRLDEATFAAAWHEGTLLPLEQALAYSVEVCTNLHQVAIPQ